MKSIVIKVHGTALATFLLIFFLPSLSNAQSGVTFSFGPHIGTIDYNYFFNQSRHGFEAGFIVNGRVANEDPFDDLTRYQFRANYQFKLLKFDRSSLNLGLGYRTTDSNSDGYIEYGFLEFPVTYSYYFLEENSAGIRVRATPLFGENPFTVIPSLGFSYYF